ncbi:hypothetical protein NFI96_024080, partial [Prochilodus magdalenae]
PPNVDSVSIKSRNETALTLEWNKVNNSSDYSYRLNYDKENITISGSEGDPVVTYTVSFLSPGYIYTFTLYTVFEGLESSGFTFTSVTTPSSVDSVSIKSRNETALTLEWNKVNNSIDYSYRLNYNGQNINISGTERDSLVTVTISSLSPGTKYTFTLYTVLEGVESSGFTFTNVTIPATVTDLHCEYASGGYGLVLVWGPPNGERTSVLVNMNGKTFNESENRLSIGGLQPAQWYTLTVIAESEGEQSNPASITCQTDPRGLLIIINYLIFFRSISLKKFPKHFNFMSREENLGFKKEFEKLNVVGATQSHTAALLPENMNKNRFPSVLAYDLSRVKLTVQNGSDYINANYIPGCGSNSKQYIAAQGPLDSTVCDFWRMVWEQKSQAIAMLINCTENGKDMCKHYWPMDCTTCTYGDLVVTGKSEKTEKSWTVREFVVKNIITSEERSVKHFHFTAWPNHGVPRTHELIQFRGVVRQHVENLQFTGPLVVHCSGGADRTGTLIALDMVLQQLEKQKAINIAACVHRMRLSRPLMVQTQSQYVFLHQCIMDSLQPEEEHIYEYPHIYENPDDCESGDSAYANAIIFRQSQTTKE